MLPQLDFLTLENEHGVKVSTVEHLLAALYIGD